MPPELEIVSSSEHASIDRDRDNMETGRNSESNADYKFTNKLAQETSPYLLQHAHNPVNWYPWSEEAFAKAIAEDKPVFLSVGYSTCYWCHVMEKQTFEDEEVAELLNEHFVAIKVDREERPDVDEQYMLATQLMTGRGGWPNSVWLTPEGKPWMAGTYYPKSQFMRLLDALTEAWKSRRTEVTEQSEKLSQAIREADSGNGAFRTAGVEQLLSRKLLDHALEEYRSSFDASHGGFSQAPKFPPHGTLQVLIHEYRRSMNSTLLPMITRTLDAMWLGGLHDHVGGGFHRYSTDRDWLVPHFEKMLYDNAQLMRIYADAHVLTGRARYREAVEDIFTWLMRDMSSVKGGFHSAIDSGEVGKEGEAYVWRHEEILDVLGAEEGGLFAEVYEVRAQGNFRDEATGEMPGTNILHLRQPLREIAVDKKIPENRFLSLMARSRAKLLARRLTLVQPHKDDKVLTGWNGLAIGALAHAGHLLNEPKYAEAAGKAAEFILSQLKDEEGQLLRTYRAGQAKLPGYLDDYAYLAEGLLELYAATQNARWLRDAQQLAQYMLDHFEDKQAGGFYFSASKHETLLIRSKNILGGGNVPDANGMAAILLMELSGWTDNPTYQKSAERSLENLAGLMWQNPRGLDTAIHAAGIHLQRKAEAKLLARDVCDADAKGEFGPVGAYVFASRRTAKPGDTFLLAIALDILKDWHLYGPTKGATAFIPTSVELDANDALVAAIIDTSRPKQVADPVLKQVLHIYEGRVWFFMQVVVKPAATEGEIVLNLKLKTQACDKERCLAPRTDALTIPLRITGDAGPESMRHREIFEADR
ncbi:MAG: DUF255 domain-containing protein [Planctomycetes bacterium]|nr:DUF255 domain-containing protein [Planctomycetota bacterium]